MTDARLRELLAGALAYAGGTHTVNDVLDAVAKGSMQMWPGVDSVIITQINEWPRRKDLYFFLAAGDMDEVKRLYSVVLDWGRAQGCTYVTTVGRPGWARTFLTREEGWTSTMLLYEREL